MLIPVLAGVQLFGQVAQRVAGGFQARVAGQQGRPELQNSQPGLGGREADELGAFGAVLRAPHAGERQKPAIRHALVELEVRVTFLAGLAVAAHLSDHRAVAGGEGQRVFFGVVEVHGHDLAQIVNKRRSRQGMG